MRNIIDFIREQFRLKFVLKTDIYARFTASLLKVLKVPGVALAAASIIVTSMSIGFLSATLEPHLRQVCIGPQLSLQSRGRYII